MIASLSDIVLPHVNRDDLAGRMAEFYTDVDKAIAAHGPVCRNRGRCCEFDGYGHKLYVTTVELVYFVRGSRRQWRQPADGRSCPYQIDRRCIAREHRPLGCRIFFCDPDARAWQGPEYERRLGELKRIGVEFGIEYRYVDWLSALEAVAPAGAAQKHSSAAGIDAAQRSMID